MPNPEHLKRQDDLEVLGTLTRFPRVGPIQVNGIHHKTGHECLVQYVIRQAGESIVVGEGMKMLDEQPRHHARTMVNLMLYMQTDPQPHEFFLLMSLSLLCSGLHRDVSADVEWNFPECRALW